MVNADFASLYTGVPLLRFVPQFSQICIIIALSKFEANPFFFVQFTQGPLRMDGFAVTTGEASSAGLDLLSLCTFNEIFLLRQYG